MRKFVSSLASVVFGLGMAVAVAASASAAVQPATNYLVTKTADGSTHSYACAPPRTIEHPAVPIVSVKNNCSTQVFLQEVHSTVCVSPGATTTGSFSPVSIAITSRTGACTDLQPDTNYAELYYGGQFHDGYACNGGANYPARNGGYTRIVVECSVRVWLKGPPAGPGQQQWNWCASPLSAEYIPAMYDDPSIIQITTNTSSC